jgi:replicative DNA helicase
MLAYLSGVDEDHILTGRYELGELSRVQYAATIMEYYSGYFIIEEISEPNLTNVESTIKKYATIDNVKFVFFDYIHETPTLLTQFGQNVRPDQVLMMLSNQLKQLAKDYNIFIFSATQVNAGGMNDDGEFKNETNIRAAKSIADKADMAYVMSRVNEKLWVSLMPALRTAARQGLINSRIIEDENYKPTHVLDIYKMRRGRYKNVRVWINLHLGTGYRKDLFITSSDNQPIGEVIDLFNSARELKLDWKNNDI